MNAEQPKRVRITTPESHEPEAGMWSNCFKVGNQVFIAGMSSKGLDGKVRAVGDAYQQSVHCFERMKAYMEAAGGSLGDIVKMTIYFPDIRGHRPDFIRARREFFTGDFPPTVGVGGVTLAGPDALVEIDAWAIIGSGPDPV